MPSLSPSRSPSARLARRRGAAAAAAAQQEETTPPAAVTHETEETRRPPPDWLHGWSLPLPDDLAAWAALPRNDQLKQAAQLTAAHAPIFPRACYLYHTARAATVLLVWLLVPKAGLATCEGFAKLVAAFNLAEFITQGTSSGPLIDRGNVTSNDALASLRDPFSLLRIRFTPGAIKNPLLPGLPMQRGYVDIALSAGYIVAMLAFLLSPVGAHFALFRAAVAMLTIGSILDRSTHAYALGFHYFPVLVTVAWAGNDPAVLIPALQAVQVAELVFAGISKLGRWFPPIVSQMIGNGPLWPQAVRRAMFRDIPACDFRPSLLATVLAHLGTVTEIVAPLAAVCPGVGPVPEALRLLGTLGCAGVNLFIFSNYPLGSVQEWNTFTSTAHLMIYYFLPVQYGLEANGIAGWIPLATAQPILSTFIAITQYAIPLYGLVVPWYFSYAVSKQYYTGNWPSKWLLLRKSAFGKFQRGVPLQPPIAPPAETTEESGSSNAKRRKDDPVTASKQQQQANEEEAWEAFKNTAFEAMNTLRHLNDRALTSVPVFKAALSNTEYMSIDSRSVLGVHHGDSTMMSDAVLRELAERCDLAPGDLLAAEVHQFCQWPGRLLVGETARWTLRDAAAEHIVVAEGVTTPDEMEREVFC